MEFLENGFPVNSMQFLLFFQYFPIISPLNSPLISPYFPLLSLIPPLIRCGVALRGSLRISSDDVTHLPLKGNANALVDPLVDP